MTITPQPDKNSMAHHGEDMWQAMQSAAANRIENTSEEEQIRQVALHEAGHAVVAFLEGFAFAKKGITIRAGKNHAGELLILTRNRRTQLRQHRRVGTLEARLRVLLAGPINEWRMTNAKPEPDFILISSFTSSGDLASIIDVLAKLFRHTNAAESMLNTVLEAKKASRADQARLPFWSENEAYRLVAFQFMLVVISPDSDLAELGNKVRADTEANVLRVLHSAARQTSYLLADNNHLVNALAEHLIGVRQMTGAELEDFMRTSRKVCTENG